MRKLIVSEWMSLDGVFDADTMDQWFKPYESDDRAEYIKQNVLTSGAMLAGRVTYEMLAGYWPQQKNNEFGIADKLNSMPKYVVSSTLKTADWKNSTIINARAMEEVTRLKQQPGQDIIVFGSAILVGALLDAGLVDEFRFLVHPNVAGTGKRFFIDGMGTKLKLARTQTLSLGVLVLYYQPEPTVPQLVRAVAAVESDDDDHSVKQGRAKAEAVAR
jgi:dihydrofolate reductase